MKSFDISEELNKLPTRFGVYLMYDEADHIIYVGKAVNLKNRVRQYFQSSRKKGVKIEQMVTHIRRFEYIVTDSELEALVLECNLIKEHHPKYNTMLTDDKTYPFIRVTVQEAFPRILFSRTMKKDGSRYFGPYTSAGAVRDTITLLQKLYHIRSCNRNLPRDTGKERPCLNYHIHQCDAPCQGYISKEAYKKKIEEALRFLNGNFKLVLQELEEKMKRASQLLEYEKAMEYRDLIASVRQVDQKQKMTSARGEDRDILGMAIQERDAVVQVFFIRGGRLIGRDHFYMRVGEDDRESQVLSVFLKQFYSGTPYLPRELFLPQEPVDREILEQWLSQKRGHKVTFCIPKKGQKEKLVELAMQNAELVLKTDKERLRREQGRTIGAEKELAKLLGLEQLHRIEAYDISNISGFAAVGAMVVYEKGKPKRNDYRKFRIRGVKGADDYASMEEMLTRRFSHGLQEIQEGKELGSFTTFPDLILMDGGKGQVNVALRVLQALQLKIPVCGMVKDDRHRTRGLYYQNREYFMDSHGEVFRLLTRIQDETHRFAITFHRSLRSKGQLHSVLDEIPGIGAVRRKALMKSYMSLEKMRNATVEELKNVPSMNEKAAKAVYEFLHGKTESGS